MRWTIFFHANSSLRAWNILALKITSSVQSASMMLSENALDYPAADLMFAAGSRVQLRSDWEAVKVREMYVGNKAKFDQNPELLRRLLQTQGNILFGASSPFWCKWNGIIMERIREEGREAGQRNEEKLRDLCEKMDSFETQQRRR
eukprot:CAMPEP_0114565116 /NCGR_PEP_ID=MMETSP0114-20121206/14123_1 /TAXON_ID=31324 /ORGANISM="Goniomonas sp, Strain m" /LENGTH=145 /DNA_ID=CAMNT_0001751311 /DNA_START=43 /DNA_END=480 /DNA_ORIENTATION=-